MTLVTRPRARRRQPSVAAQPHLRRRATGVL